MKIESVDFCQSNYANLSDYIKMLLDMILSIYEHNRIWKSL